MLFYDSIKTRIESEINHLEECRRLLYLEIKRYELFNDDRDFSNNLNNNNNFYMNNNNLSGLKRKSTNKKGFNEENNKKTKSISVTDILFFLN